MKLNGLDVTASSRETQRQIENMYDFDISFIRRAISQLSAVPMGHRTANEYVIALMLSHNIRPGMTSGFSFAQFWLSESKRVENTAAAISVFFVLDVAFTVELVRRLVTKRVEAAVDPLRFYYNHAYYMWQGELSYEGSDSTTEQRQKELAVIVAYTLDEAIRVRSAEISAFMITGRPTSSERERVTRGIVDLTIDALAERIEKTRPDASRFVNRIARLFAESYVETISNYIGGYYTTSDADFSLRIAIESIVDTQDAIESLLKYFKTGIVDFKYKPTKANDGDL